MAIYYVLGITTVAWALALAAMGILRENFPPEGAALRAVIVVTALLVTGTITSVIAKSHKEHPRAEARRKAAEEANLKRAATPPGKPPSGVSKSIKTSEKEFSIALAQGNKLKPGKYTIDDTNVGKIQHDLAVEGNGIKGTKTPLLNPGGSATLTVDLKPGKYAFYCTVPGHRQSGMNVNVTVG